MTGNAFDAYAVIAVAVLAIYVVPALVVLYTSLGAWNYLRSRPWRGR